MTRRVPLIVVAVALLLTVAFWFLAYRPRAEQLVAYQDETAQLEVQAADLRAQIATLQAVQQDADVYQSRLMRLTDYIPDALAQPDALGELQRIADQSGLDITELVYADPEQVVGAPETGEADTTLASVPIQMTVDGGYFQVVDMLRRIEVDLARAVRIDTVSAIESEDEFPDLAVTCTGVMFAVLPIDEVLGQDGQAIESTASESSTESASEGASESGASDATDDSEAGTS